MLTALTPTEGTIVSLNGLNGHPHVVSVARDLELADLKVEVAQLRERLRATELREASLQGKLQTALDRADMLARHWREAMSAGAEISQAVADQTEARP